MIDGKKKSHAKNGVSRPSRVVPHLNLATATVTLMSSGITAAVPTFAQVSKSGFSLPMDLALEAAREAVRSCEANGYNVTATVVDVIGTSQVVVSGDYATIYTKNSAHRKAYTVGTMGPIFHVTTTSQFLAALMKYPRWRLSLSHRPQMSPLWPAALPSRSTMKS